MKIENAQIIKTYLGIRDKSDHIMGFTLTLDVVTKPLYCDGWYVGILTFEVIFDLLEALDVESWEELNGKRVRIKCEGNKIIAIGASLKDTWYILCRS